MMTTAPSEPIVMEAGGVYSQNNPSVISIANHVVPVVCEAVATACSASIAGADDSTFTFCDLGTADGATGSVVANAVIDRVKSINKAKSVQIVFVDIPENDFSLIFGKHQQVLCNGLDNVYVSVVGRSFYKQCLPPESVDVSFSSMALMYPDFDTDADHDPPKPFHDLGASFKWRNESKNSNDWERFLVHRAHELKENGQLVAVQLLYPSDMNGSSSTDEAYRVRVRKYSSFFEVYEELRKEGRLHPDEFFFNPEKDRTLEEVEAPFLEESSAVRQAGLRLCSVEKSVIPCRIAKRFRDGQISKEGYGYELANCFRSWSYMLVANSLRAERSREEKESLVEEVFSRLAKCIATKVSGPDAGLPYAVSILVAKKGAD